MRTIKDTSPALQRIDKFKRDILKELLQECTESQHMNFKRMYSHKALDIPINEAVDKMADDKIDWAICQCETTVKKNKTSANAPH